MIGYILGLLAGAASPTQASVNSRVREDLRSPYTTSIVSFVSASVIMLFVVLALEHSLYIPLGTIARQPFWIWLGGTCGTAIVFLNIICLPRLGSAPNVMLICFGQTMTGLIIDQFGLFGSVQISMSLRRLIGSVLVIAGIALVNGLVKPPSDAGRSDNAGGTAKGAELLAYSLLAILCGFACAAQIAINGTLKDFAGSAFKATQISMAVGFISAVILTMTVMLIKGRYGIYDGGRDHGPVRFRYWMPAGGALAIVVVLSNAVAAPILGTGIVAILNLVGMMAMSLWIDATGFLGIDKQPVTVIKVVGMILMTAGSALISI
jgi:transporter family-2 protein